MVRVYSRRVDLFVTTAGSVPVIDLDTEIALRAAVNVLRDSIECGRMPSGLPLAPEAVDLHERAAQHFEALLAAGPMPPCASLSVS